MVMILHAGAVGANRQDVLDVPIPESTKTYGAVAHGEIIDLVEHRLSREWSIPKETLDWRFGLNNDGNKLFAMCSLPDDALVANVRDKRHSPSLVFRNSYDRSMSFGLGGGLRTFICDNLALSGDFVQYHRKHTPAAWDEIRIYIMGAVASMGEAFSQTQALLDRLEQQSMTQDDGYRMLGWLRGHRLLTATQESDAFKLWKEKDSIYQQTVNRSPYRLYQEVTQVYRDRARPEHRLALQTRATKAFAQTF